MRMVAGMLSGQLGRRAESRANPTKATKHCRPLGNKRRGSAAVVAAIASLGIAACGGTCGGSEDPGSSDSKVDRAPGQSPKIDRGNTQRSELANAGFERRTLTGWQIGGEQHASFAVTGRSSWEGQCSARIRARGTPVRGSVVLGQLVERAAGAAPGSRYRLVLRVRARGLNRPVSASIKMRYDNGNVDVFLGRAEPGPLGSAELGTGVPPGTSRRWITVRVDAVAKRRIGAMGIYAYDSGPGPLRGTVWIDSVELSSRETDVR
jgi:hypothetical protein